MLASSIPTKFPIPWGNSAGGGFIRPIPTASQIGITPGAASLTDGFPPLNFDPVAGGGIPPFGQDFNGILNQLTSWAQWQATGAAAKWDGTFATAIGGYPKGSVLQNNLGNLFVISTIDNNTNNPNSVSTGWIPLLNLWEQTSYAATGTTNAHAITLNPAPTLQSQVGGTFRITSPGGVPNTGPVTLNVNSLGALPVIQRDLRPLVAGSIPAGDYTVAYDGAGHYQLLDPSVQLAAFVSYRATAAGYKVYPDGMIENWGATTIGGGTSFGVSYALAFPNAALNVSAASGGTSSYSSYPPIFNIRGPGSALYGFILYNPNGFTIEVDWRVTGY